MGNPHESNNIYIGDIYSLIKHVKSCNYLNSSISKDTYWNRYKDPSGQFTAKLEEFARSGSKRQDELVKELQIIFFQDLQYIPIGETRNIVAMTANLQGVTETMKFSNSPNFTNAWLSD